MFRLLLPLLILAPSLTAAQAVTTSAAAVADTKAVKPVDSGASGTNKALDKGGFGLTLPLFSIRYRENGDAYVNGPVKAGLGGGYFWDLNKGKNDSFAHGPEVFVYSEGLDPTGMFQIGLAAGYQIAATNSFQFGIAAGYDLIRQETGTGTNGLLTLKRLGQESFSFLITLAIGG